jgi:hypothetical protein
MPVIMAKHAWKKPRRLGGEEFPHAAPNGSDP